MSLVLCAGVRRASMVLPWPPPSHSLCMLISLSASPWSVSSCMWCCIVWRYADSYPPRISGAIALTLLFLVSCSTRGILSALCLVALHLWSVAVVEWFAMDKAVWERMSFYKDGFSQTVRLVGFARLHFFNHFICYRGYIYFVY